MPFVQFRAAAVKEYGLPQACPCCGNDDDGQFTLETTNGGSNAWRYGCCLLSLFFGPIGWVCGGLALFAKDTKIPFPLPICRLCLQARGKLWQRFVGTELLAVTAFFFGLFNHSSLGSAAPWLLLLSSVVGLFSLADYVHLRLQFRVTVKNSNRDMALIQVPYDEYPALYQRHLDNAVLYGSSDKLGALSEE